MIRTLDLPRFILKDWRDFPRCPPGERRTADGGSCWTFNPAELRAGLAGALVGGFLASHFGPEEKGLPAALVLVAGLVGGLYIGYYHPEWLPGNDYTSKEEASYAYAEDRFGPMPKSKWR